MDKNLNRIIEELASKHNLSEFRVGLIVRSQFELVRDVISDDDHDSLQLIHLGKFQLSEKRVNNLKNNKNED